MRPTRAAAAASSASASRWRRRTTTRRCTSSLPTSPSWTCRCSTAITPTTGPAAPSPSRGPSPRRHTPTSRATRRRRWRERGRPTCTSQAGTGRRSAPSPPTGPPPSRRTCSAPSTTCCDAMDLMHTRSRAARRGRSWRWGRPSRCSAPASTWTTTRTRCGKPPRRWPPPSPPSRNPLRRARSAVQRQRRRSDEACATTPSTSCGKRSRTCSPSSSSPWASRRCCTGRTRGTRTPRRGRSGPSSSLVTWPGPAACSSLPWRPCCASTGTSTCVRGSPGPCAWRPTTA
mmetsp:Transcript_28844/g.89298  ORF Transcript_28844/g.89298 Transcript_28844/m.89298 type:complete len:287 (-) Transcript_28844:769-1629(-)